MIQGILLIACGLTGLWDGFTTFYGTSQIVGDEDIQVIAASIFAIIIGGFLFGTKFIWEYYGEAFLVFLLRSLWLVAFFYDIYTSFIGNRDIIFGQTSGGDQIMILIGMTILVSGAPIIFSFLIDE